MKRSLKTCILFLSLGLLLLSSCAMDSEADPDETSKSEVTLKTVGTQGRLIPIDSDNVRAAGYDDASKTMTVQFDSGWTYEYYGVSPELWLAFLAAQPNPWSQVGYPLLVEAGVPYQRIS